MLAIGFEFLAIKVKYPKSVSHSCVEESVNKKKKRN